MGGMAGAGGRGAMGGAGGGGGRGGDVNQMLDNLPAMPISELKPGDAIMVSTTQGTEAGRGDVAPWVARAEAAAAAATSTRCWITYPPCRFPNSNPVTPSWFPLPDRKS